MNPNSHVDAANRQTIRAAKTPPTIAYTDEANVLEPALAALELVAGAEEVELGAVALLELALPVSLTAPPPTLAGETELAAFPAADRYPLRDLSLALCFVLVVHEEMKMITTIRNMDSSKKSLGEIS